MNGNNTSIEKAEDDIMDMTYEKFTEDNSLNYKILEMKFQQGKNSSEIATALHKSAKTIEQRYRRFSWSLYKCYFQYLREVGLEVDAADIRNFYESSPHAAAYLEKTYGEALCLFRRGDPPVFLENIKSLPPYRKLSDIELLNLERNIVKARSSQNKTFSDIGKELAITREKARWIHNHYYHKKVVEALERIKTHTGNDLSYSVFEHSNYSSKRWELIVRDYSDLVWDLIDN